MKRAAFQTVGAPATDWPQQQIFEEWSGAPFNPALARPALVHELFEAQADARPSQTAVECGDDRLTYGELDARANQLAHHLRRLGVSRGACVALQLERWAQLYVAMFAVLKAGAAYVPLDPDCPAERVRFVLADCSAKVLLTDSSLSEQRRELCDNFGAMLVFDEIQCGMGRSGKMFACEHDGVRPDLMALRKGFGGVMPIGATVGTPKTWQKYIENPFLHTTTFGGNPVCCAAAIATINVLLEEDLPAQAGKKGECLLKHINDLAKKYSKVLKLCRGRGLMLGMEFAENDLGYEVAKNLFARQILISGTYINARVLRIEPPPVIPQAQLDRFLEALEDSLRQVYKDHRL
jgi:hypothetical protein